MKSEKICDKNAKYDFEKKSALFTFHEKKESKIN